MLLGVSGIYPGKNKFVNVSQRPEEEGEAKPCAFHCEWRSRKKGDFDGHRIKLIESQYQGIGHGMKKCLRLLMSRIGSWI